MVYLLLADGFEEIEALTTVDILRRSGIEVKTVGISSEAQTGAHDICVVCDIQINEVNKNDMEMLILPGGAGYELLDASNDVHGLINHCVANNIYISAICAAPSVLGKKGLLENKKAVCYPGFEKYLYGAQIQNCKAVKDGIFITGKGPGASSDFAFLIASTLKGEESAEKLKGMMCY